MEYSFAIFVKNYLASYRNKNYLSQKLPPHSGRGSLKCQRYYISLYSEVVNEGGQKSSKFCQRNLWMPPEP